MTMKNLIHCIEYRINALIKTRGNHAFRNTKREMTAQESVYLDRREMALPEGSMALVKDRRGNGIYSRISATDALDRVCPPKHMKGPEEAVDVLQRSVRLRVSLFERRCLRDQMGSWEDEVVAGVQ
jgi:hypothetical protein